MKLYIANAFSLNMLVRDEQRGTPNGYTPRADDALATARVPRPVDNPVEVIEDYAKFDVPVVSIVGHEKTALEFSVLLCRSVGFNRATIKLEPDDRVLVGQYVGSRLDEGATTLPVQKFEWWII